MQDMERDLSVIERTTLPIRSHVHTHNTHTRHTRALPYTLTCAHTHTQTHTHTQISTTQYALSLKCIDFISRLVTLTLSPSHMQSATMSDLKQSIIDSESPFSLSRQSQQCSESLHFNIVLWNEREAPRDE